MNWTVYTEALYAYFQLIHCIYIFLFRYFTSLHRGVSQQQQIAETLTLTRYLTNFLTWTYHVIKTVFRQYLDRGAF